MKKPRITVVGSNMVDLITYVTRMPSRGETIIAPEFSMGFGGKGANQAVAAALLGADVSMISKVGDDPFGPGTIDNLKRHGIDTRFVGVAARRSSGAAPIFVEPDSSNRILIVKGANEMLQPSDIDEAVERIRESDMVVLQLEIPLETIYYTVDLCGRHSIPVLLNPAPADPDLDLERIDTVDFFVPNESELNTLTGMPVGSTSDIAAAAGTLHSRGIAQVIVTMGERGALVLDEAGERIVPPLPVRAVDSTGAGDAFVGCFACTYAEAGIVDDAVSTANRYAALSTTRPGTQKSFLSREEFIQSGGMGGHGTAHPASEA